MKNLYKFIIMFTIVTLSFVVSSNVAFADEYYDITKYDVVINVNENNVFDIVETISVEFYSSRHGIYRDITTKGTMTRVVDGEVLSNKYAAKISDVYVYDYNYSVSKSYNQTSIKIGDADVYVNGRQEYVISYTMDFGDDGIEEFDEFYFNLIGNEWYASIYEANITVVMPKDFDESKIGLSSGTYGYSGSDILQYYTDGNIINVNTTDTLYPYNGITMRIELPEGYFVNERVPYDWMSIYKIFVLILLLVVIFLWVIYGKDEKIFPSVEFYPPEDLSPAEIGYIVDGYVDSKDVVSLIIYWADKGYVKLVEEKRSEFLIIKLKDLPNSAEYYEVKMFKGLFSSGHKLYLDDINGLFEGSTDFAELTNPIIEKVNNREQFTGVRIKDLKNVFYTTIDTVSGIIERNYKNREETKLFTTSSKVVKFLTFMIFTLPVFFYLMLVRIPDAYLVEEVVFGGIMRCGLIIAMFVFADRVIAKWNSTKKASKSFKLIILIIMMVGMWGSFSLVLGTNSTALLAICSTYIMGFFAVFMDKRTKRSNELLEKILGLKMFIENAEKDKINVMVEENPEYFYNVLSYAYVLGVTDKWAKQFEHLATEPPNWYLGRSTSGMNTTNFTSSFTRGMGAMQSNMTSRPSSSGSSGSGSSGGGFSGGGGGGGGGGSW